MLARKMLLGHATRDSEILLEIHSLLLNVCYRIYNHLRIYCTKYYWLLYIISRNIIGSLD